MEVFSRDILNKLHQRLPFYFSISLCLLRRKKISTLSSRINIIRRKENISLSIALKAKLLIVELPTFRKLRKVR